MKDWNWKKILIWILVIMTVVYVIGFVLGSGSDSTSQGATPKHPSAAWIKKGQLLYISTTVGQAQAASRNKREACATHWAYRKFHALAGTMFWVRLTKTWCYSRKSHRVTQTPAPKIQYGVTTIGALLQWNDEGMGSQSNGYYYYKGYPQGGHRSSVQVDFKRCFPTPFGCVRVDAHNMGVSLIGHFDGSYTIN